VPEQNTQISENKLIRYSIPVGWLDGLIGCDAAWGDAVAMPRKASICGSMIQFPFGMAPRIMDRLKMILIWNMG
jgi:hypothetical protein